MTERNFSQNCLNEPGTVVHLHGAISKPETMVVTTKDYLEHYDHENVKEFLGELFEKKTILFLGYGLKEAEVLEHILRRGSAKPTSNRRRFALQGRVFKISKDQYSFTQILKNLAEYKKTLTNVERAMGVAVVDLYLPDLKFVYGEADPKEGVAVISITRLGPEFYGLPPDEKLFHQRIIKEAAHELGHTYHLGHCPDPACVMHFSGTLQDSDRKGETFCSRCRSRRMASISPS